MRHSLGSFADPSYPKIGQFSMTAKEWTVESRLSFIGHATLFEPHGSQHFAVPRGRKYIYPPLRLSYLFTSPNRPLEYHIIPIYDTHNFTMLKRSSSQADVFASVGKAQGPANDRPPQSSKFKRSPSKIQFLEKRRNDLAREAETENDGSTCSISGGSVRWMLGPDANGPGSTRAYTKAAVDAVTADAADVASRRDSVITHIIEEGDEPDAETTSLTDQQSRATEPSDMDQATVNTKSRIEH